MVCAGRRWAGESSRCEDGLRPYSRHCEEIVAGYAAPTIVYAHIGINWSDEWEDNDAVRRVATSSGKRGNRI